MLFDEYLDYLPQPMCRNAICSNHVSRPGQTCRQCLDYIKPAPQKWCGMCGLSGHTISGCKEWKEPVPVVCGGCRTEHVGSCPRCGGEEWDYDYEANLRRG